MSQLENERDEANKRLEEALNHAKGLETAHTESLAKLQAECDARVKAAEGKCIEVEGVNIKLRHDLASRMEKIADLSQELDDATDDFKGAVYDSFCNCGRQLRLANPGVELSFRGVSPDYVFNRSGILVHTDSLKPVNLKEARQVLFDPDLDYDVKQPTVKVEAKGSVDVGPSQTDS